MKEKEITINGLASKVDSLADTVDTLAKKMERGFRVFDTKFNDLAASVASGFKTAKKDTDDLAGMMARYTTEIQHQFDSVNKRLDDHDQRFDQLDNEIKSTRAELFNGLREIKSEIKRLDERIDKLLKMNNEDILALVEEMDKIKLRVKKLELKNSHT